MVSRRLFLLAPFLVAARVEAAGFHVTGKLGATDQEAQEGYFALGKELMIVTKPNSPVHDTLRGMVGSEVQCSVFTVANGVP